MRIFYKVLVLMLLVSIQPIFADDYSGMSSDTDSSCKMIAKSCVAAGYSGKKFWFDCMKPVLLNKSVNKVNVDATAIQTCRAKKIEDMKKLLEEFQKVGSN